MDKFLKQKFEIGFLKIGIIANSSVLQIGVGAGSTPRIAPSGYTTIGEHLAPLIAPPAVPLQAAVRMPLQPTPRQPFAKNNPL